MRSSSAAIELEGLTKDFAVGLRGVRLRAVDHLNLRIERGQIYGLLGPNGSGKSTTIKIILGLAEPTAGRCRVFGIPSHQAEARRSVGYLPDAPYFQGYLTGREMVRFHGRLAGLAGRKLETRVRETLAWTRLEDAANRRLETYSKGMLQRIGVAQMLVHEPEFVVLDEPTAGLDPAGVEAITELVLKLKYEGKTVLITSHLLSQVEEVCDRVAILDHGRLTAECAVSELGNHAWRQTLVVSRMPDAELAELEAWLESRGRTLESVGVLRSLREDSVSSVAVGAGRREARTGF